MHSRASLTVVGGRLLAPLTGTDVCRVETLRGSHGKVFLVQMGKLFLGPRKHLRPQSRAYGYVDGPWGIPYPNQPRERSYEYDDDESKP